MDISDTLLQILETKLLESNMDDQKREDALEEISVSVENFSKTISLFFESSDAFLEMAISMLEPVLNVKNSDTSDFPLHIRAKFDFLSSVLPQFERETSVNKLKLFETFVDILLPSLEKLTSEDGRALLNALSNCMPKMREMGFEETMNLAYNIRSVLRNSQKHAVKVLKKMCILIEEGMNPNAVLRKTYELGLDYPHRREIEMAQSSDYLSSSYVEGSEQPKSIESIESEKENLYFINKEGGEATNGETEFAKRFLLLADMTINLKKLAPDYRLHSWALIKGVDELLRTCREPKFRDDLLLFSQKMLNDYKINPYWVMCYIPNSVPSLEFDKLLVVSPLCKAIGQEEDTSRREAESRGAFKYGITMLGRATKDWNEFELGVKQLSNLVEKIRTWGISSEVLYLASNLNITQFSELNEVFHYLNSIGSRDIFLRSLNYYLPIELNLLNRKLSELPSLCEKLSKFDSDILTMLCQRLSSSDIQNETTFFSLLTALNEVFIKMECLRADKHEGKMKSRMYGRRAIASYIEIWKHISKTQGYETSQVLAKFGKLCAEHPTLVNYELARHLCKIYISECEKILEFLCKLSDETQSNKSDGVLRLGFALAKLYQKYEDFENVFKKIILICEKKGLPISLISNAYERISDANDADNFFNLLSCETIDSKVLAIAMQTSSRLGVIEMRQALKESLRLGEAGIDAVRELLVVSSYLSKKGIKGKAQEGIMNVMSSWFERLSKMGCMPIGSIALLPLSVIQSTSQAINLSINQSKNQEPQVLNKALLQLEEVLLKTNEEDRMLIGYSVLRMNVHNFSNTLQAFERCINFRRKNKNEYYVFELARQVLELTNYGEHAVLLLDRILEAKNVPTYLVSTSLISKYASYHEKLDLFSTYLHVLNELSGMMMHKGMNECDIFSVGTSLAVCKSAEEMDVLARLFKEHISAEHVCNEIPDISRYVVECKCNLISEMGNREISGGKRCVMSSCLHKVLSFTSSVEKRYSFIPRFFVRVCENPDDFVERCKFCIESLNSMNEFEKEVSEIILRQLFIKGNLAIRTSYEVEQSIRAIAGALDKLRSVKDKDKILYAFSESLFTRCVSNYDFQEHLGIVVDIVMQGIDKGLDVQQILNGLSLSSKVSHELAIYTMRGCLRLLSAGINPLKFVLASEKIYSIFGRRAPEIMTKIASAYIANQPEKGKEIDEIVTNIKNRAELEKFLEDFIDKR